MRLLLATHAETDWTTVGRFQGHTDVPLNERGRQQAAIMQGRLAQEPLGAIVASDLSRAWQTAEILALSHGVPVTADRRLREMGFGAWEGLTYAEVQRTDATALSAWQANPFGAHPPGGESMAELVRRLQAFLDELAIRREATILLVAHRGALRVLLCLLLDVPVERHWEFRLDVASVSELEWRDGNAMLLRLNESEGA
jgi:alpha-ribazole phosphatase/probable phosphoglycerate mutase